MGLWSDHFTSFSIEDCPILSISHPKQEDSRVEDQLRAG